MILVTGGTGGIGSELLRLLSQAGVDARALTRNPHKTQKLPGITWIPGDLSRPETLTTAFDGAKTLFLNTSYYEDMVALQHNAIAAARAAGVTHVVKVSAFARLGPLRGADRPMALPGRERTAGIGDGLDHPPASPFHAEPSGPGRVHHQGRCRLLGFRRRQDSVHRLSRHRRGRLRHAHPAGTRRQEVCADRKRSDLVPAGCGDHRRCDRQAAALRRRVTRGSAGTPRARRPAPCRHRERSRDRRVSACRRKNRDDTSTVADLTGRPPRPSPNSLANMLPSSAARNRALLGYVPAPSRCDPRRASDAEEVARAEREIEAGAVFITE